MSRWLAELAKQTHDPNLLCSAGPHDSREAALEAEGGLVLIVAARCDTCGHEFKADDIVPGYEYPLRFTAKLAAQTQRWEHVGRSARCGGSIVLTPQNDGVEEGT